MKKLLIAAGLFLLSFASFASGGLPPAQAKDQVMFITGGINNNHPAVHFAAIQVLGDYVTSHHPAAEFRVIHNSHWEAICEDLTNLKKQSPAAKIILVGESWGAQAIVDIAFCLEKAKVQIDLAITIDSIHKWFHPMPDVIPASITTNFSYFEDKDATFNGHPNHRRDDGSHVGIENTYVDMTGDSWPHMNITHRVVKDPATHQMVSDALLK